MAINIKDVSSSEVIVKSHLLTYIWSGTLHRNQINIRIDKMQTRRIVDLIMLYELGFTSIEESVPLPTTHQTYELTDTGSETKTVGLEASSINIRIDGDWVVLWVSGCTEAVRVPYDQFQDDVMDMYVGPDDFLQPIPVLSEIHNLPLMYSRHWSSPSLAVVYNDRAVYMGRYVRNGHKYERELRTPNVMRAVDDHGVLRRIYENEHTASITRFLDDTCYLFSAE